MRKYFRDRDVGVIAYCLMPNHYHFLLRQDGQASAGKTVQFIFNGYSKAFNEMFERTGTLFEGPFKAALVNEEEYLLHLCRYIHRNPLDAQLVDKIESWEYSNYREWIGLREDALVDRLFIRERFPSAGQYTRFVSEYTPPDKMDDEMRIYCFDTA